MENQSEHSRLKFGWFESGWAKFTRVSAYFNWAVILTKTPFKPMWFWQLQSNPKTTAHIHCIIITSIQQYNQCLFMDVANISLCCCIFASPFVCLYGRERGRERESEFVSVFVCACVCVFVNMNLMCHTSTYLRSRNSSSYAHPHPPHVCRLSGTRNILQSICCNRCFSHLDHCRLRCFIFSILPTLFELLGYTRYTETVAYVCSLFANSFSLFGARAVYTRLLLWRRRATNNKKKAKQAMHKMQNIFSCICVRCVCVLASMYQHSIVYFALNVFHASRLVRPSPLTAT